MGTGERRQKMKLALTTSKKEWDWHWPYEMEMDLALVRSKQKKSLLHSDSRHDKNWTKYFRRNFKISWITVNSCTHRYCSPSFKACWRWSKTFVSSPMTASKSIHRCRSISATSSPTLPCTMLTTHSRCVIHNIDLHNVDYSQQVCNTQHCLDQCWLHTTSMFNTT